MRTELTITREEAEAVYKMIMGDPFDAEVISNLSVELEDFYLEKYEEEDDES